MERKSEAQIFLEQVEKVDAIIPNKLIEMQQWYDLATSITASMNGECVQSSGSKQKMADAINKCLDVVDDLTSQVDQLKSVKTNVTQTIEQLYSPTEYKVLHMRYIQYKTLEDIDSYFKKSDGWAKVTCHRATKHVQVVLNKKEQRNDSKRTD